jgi:hypothetical protein
MTATQIQDTETQFPTLWAPLDAINCAADDNDDGPGPLSRAVDAIESTKAALMAGKPYNAGMMAKVLDSALRDLRAVSGAVAGLTDALGVLEGWAD